MTGAKGRAFASVVLDVDSTLCGIEGIDWLAAGRGEAIAIQVAEQTERAMRGEIPLEDVYGARLDLARPSAGDIEELSRAYEHSLAPGAREAITLWREDGIRVVLVSGGIRQAILPVAISLGIPVEDVHAVMIHIGPDSRYAGFDASSPLTTASGKRDVVAGLSLARPTLAVGDGVTDLAMREFADVFCAFTGFGARPAVTGQADVTSESFAALSRIVLMGVRRD
ncbi:MAG: HAD-IB family phosphatase [Gemmatimonadaceae bacterium]